MSDQDKQKDATPQEQEQEQQWHHIATVEDLGGLKRKIDIVYDVEGVRMALDKACQLVGKNVQVKGFRKGKAPQQLVERFCHKEIEKVASSMLSEEGYLHAVHENNFSALTKPQVDNPEFHMDGTFSCSVKIEVRPAITPTGYVGIQLTKPVEDTAVRTTELVEGLRRRFAKTVERDLVGPGATVVMDYCISVDGSEVMKQENQSFMVNADGDTPFGTTLVGTKVGETKIDKMKLPADFKDHGGKEADLTIIVRKVTDSIPATDEEFVAQSGAPSMDEIRSQAQQRAGMEAERKTRQSLEAQVVDKLLLAHSFEVPEEWVKDEERYLASQLGISGEMDEKTRDAVHELADKNVRRTFILDAVYDAEPSLKVKPEEVEDLLEQEALRQGVPKVRLKHNLLKKKLMDGVISAVKNKKIMDFLIANAEVVSEGQTQQQENTAPVVVPITG